VGTPADYLEACLSIGKAEGDVLQIGRGSVIERSAHVAESVIWDDVTVGAGAALERCIVADGVQFLLEPPSAIAPLFREGENSSWRTLRNGKTIAGAAGYTREN